MVNEVVAAASSDLKNRDKFRFNNKLLPKNQLVLEVICFVAKKHSVASFTELLPLFEDKLSTDGRVSNAKNSWVVRPLEEAQLLGLRYFKKEEQIIVLSSGERAVVSTQWGNNINYFIEKIDEKFSIVVERVKQ